MLWSISYHIIHPFFQVLESDENSSVTSEEVNTDVHKPPPSYSLDHVIKPEAISSSHDSCDSLLQDDMQVEVGGSLVHMCYWMVPTVSYYLSILTFSSLRYFIYILKYWKMWIYHSFEIEVYNAI